MSNETKAALAALDELDFYCDGSGVRTQAAIATIRAALTRPEPACPEPGLHARIAAARRRFGHLDKLLSDPEWCECSLAWTHAHSLWDAIREETP